MIDRGGGGLGGKMGVSQIGAMICLSNLGERAEEEVLRQCQNFGCFG